MIRYPSPNFEERRAGVQVQLVVLHGTWTRDIQETLAFLTDDNPAREGGRVSCHYVIDKDGTVYHVVDEDKRAWHAGVSFWRGIDDVNSASIGIELQNDGREPYPPAQIGTLVPLLHSIMTRHQIGPEDILAHSDVAPGRKDDPGAHFPWPELAACGVALWPDAESIQPDQVSELLADETLLVNAIMGWGYDPGCDTAEILAAFDRHFVPESFLGGSAPSALRARRLAALWAAKMDV